MRTLVSLLAAVLLSLVAGCASVAPAPRSDVLQVLNVTGEVNEKMVAETTQAIDKIVADPSVTAVLLVVDSPGGGMIESAEMYEQLSRIAVPVVGWCQHVCASGGMYLLMSPSVRYIGLRTGTVAGSIGVIMHLERSPADSQAETYKSGVFKDAGSRAGPPDPVEVAYLQSQVDELAQQFYRVVDEARGAKITPDNWVLIKQARVFFGEGAVKIGLADEVMPRERAVWLAEQMARKESGSTHMVVRQ